ncbi:hypothetical protein DSAG12_02632 [Promethearchaeum syntrophicum]|uniref:Uncharacterized protein n=1 Tax=Promethearchaeum syntrophicum TaxID=2594042 RepID=A0A5B9DCG3_9ARCH|nr:hypothetical protein [Candidatus Prometheoarchaeum syntrophicum]QEE16802.1 hypothetical protein DSAG12_02632 [Candidatus Prometheoarchaeum syntrophicum]
MKKRFKFIALTTTFVFLVLFLGKAAADSTSFVEINDINSSEATKTVKIDGILEEGEWEDADHSVIWFNVKNTSYVWSYETNRQMDLYFKNDANYLLFALKINDVEFIGRSGHTDINFSSLVGTSDFIVWASGNDISVGGSIDESKVKCVSTNTLSSGQGDIIAEFAIQLSILNIQPGEDCKMHIQYWDDKYIKSTEFRGIGTNFFTIHTHQTESQVFTYMNFASIYKYYLNPLTPLLIGFATSISLILTNRIRKKKGLITPEISSIEKNREIVKMSPEEHVRSTQEKDGNGNSKNMQKSQVHRTLQLRNATFVLLGLQIINLFYPIFDDWVLFQDLASRVFNYSILVLGILITLVSLLVIIRILQLRGTKDPPRRKPWVILFFLLVPIWNFSSGFLYTSFMPNWNFIFDNKAWYYLWIEWGLFGISNALNIGTWVFFGIYLKKSTRIQVSTGIIIIVVINLWSLLVNALNIIMIIGYFEILLPLLFFKLALIFAEFHGIVYGLLSFLGYLFIIREFHSLSPDQSNTMNLRTSALSKKKTQFVYGFTSLVALGLILFISINLNQSLQMYEDYSFLKRFMQYVNFRDNTLFLPSIMLIFIILIMVTLFEALRSKKIWGIIIVMVCFWITIWYDFAMDRTMWETNYFFT